MKRHSVYFYEYQRLIILVYQSFVIAERPLTVRHLQWNVSLLKEKQKLFFNMHLICRCDILCLTDTDTETSRCAYHLSHKNLTTISDKAARKIREREDTRDVTKMNDPVNKVGKRSRSIRIIALTLI